MDQTQLRLLLKLTCLREKQGRLKVLLRTQVGGKEAQGERERGVWAQRKRQNSTDDLFKEYLEHLVQTPSKRSLKKQKKDREEIEDVLELYAKCAALRPSSTTRDQDGQALKAFELALVYSSSSSSSSKQKNGKEFEVVDDDLARVVGRFLSSQEEGRRKKGLEVMRKMAENKKGLTTRVMRSVVGEYYGRLRGNMVVDREEGERERGLVHFRGRGEEEDRIARRGEADEYSHARQVLDQVCSSTTTRSSTLRLDELLRIRLERVDRLEELDKRPKEAFLKWLGLRDEAGREEVEVALRVWEAGVGKGEDGEESIGRSYRKVGEELVLQACRIGKQQENLTDEGAGQNRLETPAPLIEDAVNLAIRYFPLQVLTHHSTPLLTALTVDSHSPDLACYLFDILNSPPSDFKFARFQWSATLLVPFTRLFFSSHRYERDPSLPIRLYLSWTSSGLTFPAGLWDPFWRTLGHGGSIEDIERVLQDWQETGRGEAASRIVRQVLKGSVDSANIQRCLELFDYFRSRYSPSLDSTPIPLRRVHLHPLVIPLDSYNTLFNLLAHSKTDHRSNLSRLFSSLLEDGHTPSTQTYDSLLAANLLRPKFKVSDIDNAGVVYNKMVENELRPDRDTFGLLMKGFNRLAIEGGKREEKQRLIGIEASLRTFKASLAGLSSSVDRNKRSAKGREGELTLARGGSVGELMVILAGEGRFEGAKQVSEEWWRALVGIEEIVGTKNFWEGREIKNECTEMRKARERVEELECGERQGEEVA